MGGNWGGIRRRGAGLGAESAAVTGGYSSAEEVETNSGGGWRAGDEETENYTYAIALQNDT